MNSIASDVRSNIKNIKKILNSYICLLDKCYIIYVKITRLQRGYFKKIWFEKSGKRIFIGKRTDIKHNRHITTGNNILINDYVEINAESPNSVVMGDNISIGKYSVIKCTGNYKNTKTGIQIGNNFSCGDFCFFGCAGGIQIGDDVIMGQNIRFHAQNHNFDRIDILIRDQGTTQKGIVIEDNCWIGAGTVFLDGVTVGRGSVIGSNTLVNKDIEPNSIAVGNPVRIVKKRA